MQKVTMKCLLIDDDADDQYFFKLALNALEVNVELSRASSGVEAFDQLTAFYIPDCIFLDLNMPKMNGREFLKKIKNIDIFKDVPVLIYSTSADAKDKTDMILLGATQFITKTNSIGELTSILKKEFAKISVSR